MTLASGIYRERASVRGPLGVAHIARYGEGAHERYRVTFTPADTVEIRVIATVYRLAQPSRDTLAGGWPQACAIAEQVTHGDANAVITNAALHQTRP